MSADFSRAKLLRQRGRHEEAVALLLSHLAHEPEDPDAFIELAINRMEIPGQLNLALANVRTACGLRPGNAYLLSLQSLILNRLNHFEDALEMARSSIAADPNQVHGWISQGHSLLHLARWKEGEDSLRTALGIDADDQTASNLLAFALRRQNRLDDSDSLTRESLSRDPENAFLFANAGYTALQRGDVKLAETRFLESLRIDPEASYAKKGLKEAYRARSLSYRLALKCSFVEFRLPYAHKDGMWKTAVGVATGFILITPLTELPSSYLRFAGSLVVALPILIIFAYLFFAILNTGVANFLLLKDPVAKASLDAAEKTEGMVTGSLFFGGLIALIAGGLLGFPPCSVAGGIMIAAAIPASLVFTSVSLLGLTVFGSLLVAVVLLGGFMILNAYRDPVQLFMDGDFVLSAYGVCILVIISATLGKQPYMWRPARR